VTLAGQPQGRNLRQIAILCDSLHSLFSVATGQVCATPQPASSRHFPPNRDFGTYSSLFSLQAREKLAGARIGRRIDADNNQASPALF